MYCLCSISIIFNQQLTIHMSFLTTWYAIAYQGVKKLMWIVSGFMWNSCGFINILNDKMLFCFSCAVLPNMVFPNLKTLQRRTRENICICLMSSRFVFVEEWLCRRGADEWQIEEDRCEDDPKKCSLRFLASQQIYQSSHWNLINYQNHSIIK